MAVGIYTLPICDGCKLPWLPVGWTQDSDPRNPEKPLRCGKCKSIGWDREFVKQQKAEATSSPVLCVTCPHPQHSGVCTDDTCLCTRFPELREGEKVTTIHTDLSTGIPTMIETIEEMSIEEAKRRYPATRTRCKHRMTECPICHPKEAA